jgi:hypothetical protein
LVIRTDDKKYMIKLIIVGKPHVIINDNKTIAIGINFFFLYIFLSIITTEYNAIGKFITKGIRYMISPGDFSMMKHVLSLDSPNFPRRYMAMVSEMLKTPQLMLYIRVRER